MTADSTARSIVVGYVPGVFDMFHIGHLNVLRRAAERCDVLVAGVVTEEVVLEIKRHPPVIPLEERLAIVSAIDCVTQAVVDRSADKRVAWREIGFDVLFKGDDWQGTPRGAEFERHMAEVGARVEYLPYTQHTSSTRLREVLDRLLESR